MPWSRASSSAVHLPEWPLAFTHSLRCSCTYLSVVYREAPTGYYIYCDMRAQTGALHHQSRPKSDFDSQACVYISGGDELCERCTHSVNLESLASVHCWESRYGSNRSLAWSWTARMHLHGTLQADSGKYLDYVRRYKCNIPMFSQNPSHGEGPKMRSSTSSSLIPFVWETQ